MDREWEIAEWDKAWLRLKLDVLVRLDHDEAIVIDYKTGRQDTNIVKHDQQLALYAYVTFMRHPELEKIQAELWYLDKNIVTSKTYTRKQALLNKRTYDKQGADITGCISWPANPNKYSCQWCLYGPEHSGHCSVGVRKA